ncbi:MAG: presenilin family intramembrane aspartyl protease [Candidatus Nanohaloarchaea archaeon]|nr:presenilin family intramembrane aspartyl protease [Candidatus Nanohaloarchaea archaeon]
MQLDDLFSPIINVYLLSHLLGLLAAISLQGTRVAQGTQVVNQNPASGLYLFGIIAVATILMILLYRYQLTALVKLWFLSAIFFTQLMFYAIFFPPAIALGAAVAGFTVRKLVPDIWTRNLIDSISYAGIGAFFGTMIGVIPAAIFLVLIAAYDIFAVFISEHMISIVEEGMDSNTFMGFMYPKDHSQNLEPGVERSPDQIDTDQLEEVQVGIIGGGDVVIPMIFAVSLMGPYGPLATAISSIGAAGGLSILLNKSREGEFYPAIPAVGGGAILGFLLYLALTAI